MGAHGAAVHLPFLAGTSPFHHGLMLAHSERTTVASRQAGGRETGPDPPAKAALKDCVQGRDEMKTGYSRRRRKGAGSPCSRTMALSSPRVPGTADRQGGSAALRSFSSLRGEGHDRELDPPGVGDDLEQRLPRSDLLRLRVDLLGRELCFCEHILRAPGRLLCAFCTDPQRTAPGFLENFRIPSR